MYHKLKKGVPGWLSHWVSAFNLGHGPRVLESSPASGSLLSGKPASPAPTPPASVPSLAVSLCQINKILKNKKKKGNE